MAPRSGTCVLEADFYVDSENVVKKMFWSIFDVFWGQFRAKTMIFEENHVFSVRLALKRRGTCDFRVDVRCETKS